VHGHVEVPHLARILRLDGEEPAERLSRHERVGSVGEELLGFLAEGHHGDADQTGAEAAEDDGAEGERRGHSAWRCASAGHFGCVCVCVVLCCVVLIDNSVQYVIES